MDPFVMLKADHREVEALFAKLEETTERGVKARTELFQKLHHDLLTHMLVEEIALYPALKEVKPARALAFEGVEEHNVAKFLLEALASLPVDSEEWTAKLAVLRENVEHHVKEEESDLFPEATKALSAEQKVVLAEHLESEKRRIHGVMEWEPMIVLPVSGEPGPLGVR